MNQPLPASISTISDCVANLLRQEDSGHGIDHANRVLRLSLKFAEAENADPTLVALVALLHDVDDYKIFGEGSAKNLTNAKTIMQQCRVNAKTQTEVERSIHEIGYNKRLASQIPITLTGKIVSDADMCDALGATSVIRAHSFGVKRGRPFFDRNFTPPKDLNLDAYSDHSTNITVLHFFEKVLRLKDFMLTEPGRQEAIERHKFTVEFLKHLFEEENASEWLDYLRKYEV